MATDLFQGRWTPGPDAAEIALLQRKQYAAVLVWRCMLRDALQTPDWQTSRAIADIERETRYSKATIIKAQKQLLAAGYIKRIAGGGKTRRTPSYSIRRPKNFGKKAQTPGETENWTL